ncbi:ABC transporter ATP-binding protein [Marinitenerispora sediminis]|uniref:ABC-type quaternary amine transporter n=1 Tax=Marinitenerispora sediminis TaxID=1931232 RepID=A0A368T017_9ACTN|nr:ABC transporter ATP-binding protein [Marinitenerispora sediminis]RCV52278.1 polyamine ABC transporter ATP-binding protein [Marinitenerispora sediminis]RCV54979.1 polyamine ABC transporter ATP-binding protein [Marinitenerispora sediminis]RCV59985.1 polyamine ABC transporter ATP-binding protein [Marinitenerispora sediminis]
MANTAETAAAPGTPVVRLDGVSREYGKASGAFAAVSDLSLDVPRGSFTTLLGPSGCGKTTTLRMIAGFVRPTSGRILLEGADATSTPPEKRNIGMVFQSYALFPHMTLRDNVAFGLRTRRIAKPEVLRRAGEALELVGLSHLADRRPAQLSGGQQQRVALARAVAVRPSVLLLDEPLSNLDARLRVQMRQELLRVQRETGLTAVLVTHDQDEALELSDHLVIMNGGRLEQQGAPREVFPAPANRFVAEFLGYQNFLTVPGHGPVTVRPEHTRLLADGEAAGGDGVLLDAQVRGVTYQGSHCLVEVAAASGDGEATLHCLHPGDDVRPGARVRIALPHRHLVALAGGAGTEDR